MAPDERPGVNNIIEDTGEQIENKREGEPTVYVCPECSGTLWQVKAGKVVRFTCHVGHVYSADDLLEGYSEVLERSLWHAARTLRDRSTLMRQLAKVALERGFTNTIARYEEEADADSRHAEVIEQMIAASATINESS